MAGVFKSGAIKRTDDKAVGVNLKKEEHLTDDEKDYLEEEVKTRPIEFKAFKDEEVVGGGMVVCLLAAHKFGKSIGAELFGYFHPDFKQYMPLGTRKLLEMGALPQINTIVHLDTECTVSRDLKHGKMRTLMKPLIDAGRIHVVETPIKRKREGVGENQKIVTMNDVDIDKERQNFESAVWNAIDKHGPNTLIIADSMSDYKKSLDDLQEILFKKGIITSYQHTKGTAADAKENEALMRQFYQYRNKWWHNILIKLRTNNCWVIETIKLGEVDEEFRAIKDDKGNIIGMKPQFYPIWGKHTQFRIDQGYTIMDYIDNDGKADTYLRYDWGKYAHSVPSFDRIGGDEKEQSKCLIRYPQNDRMAMMKLIDDMSKDLLGETNAEEEAKLWGSGGT